MEQSVTKSSASYKFPVPSQITTWRGSQLDRENTKQRRGGRESKDKERERESAQPNVTAEENKGNKASGKHKQERT